MGVDGSPRCISLQILTFHSAKYFIMGLGYIHLKLNIWTHLYGKIMKKIVSDCIIFIATGD